MFLIPLEGQKNSYMLERINYPFNKKIPRCSKTYAPDHLAVVDQLHLSWMILGTELLSPKWKSVQLKTDLQIQWLFSYYQEGLMSLLVIFSHGVYVFDLRSHLGNSYDRQSRVKSE